MKRKKIIIVILYAAIGGLLGSAGIHAMEDWQFFPIMLCVLAIDILSKN